MSDLRFGNPRMAAYCCGHVFRQERKALLVVRDDEEWQFLCGHSDHNDPLEPYHICVGALIEADPTLHQISDLPPEWEAERMAVCSAWLKTKAT